MLALKSGTSASDSALVAIATAFAKKQTFPLTEEGKSFQSDLIEVLDRKDIAWLRQNSPQLPTVENPHPELFGELDFGSLREMDVVGHKLNVVQTHVGCSHDCEDFCSADAPTKIVSRMPFMAVSKIASSKWRYDRKYAHICANWRRHISKMGLVPDNDEHKLDKRIRGMKTVGEIYDFLIEAVGLWENHPIFDHSRLWLINDAVDLPFVWEKYANFLPVLFSSMQNSILTYNDSDPIEYNDPRFRHEDGSLADFGDVFSLMDSFIRPVFISTAGWVESNVSAESAMKKVVNQIKGDRLSAGIRLSIKRYEKLARLNPEAYLSNLKRILSILGPLHDSDNLILKFYYDPKIDGDKLWADRIIQELDTYAKSRLGYSIDSFSGYAAVSHYRGRAYDSRYAEKEWDSDDVWGYEILPDGRVTWRDEAVLVEKMGEGDQPFLHAESPMIAPVYTGVTLW